MSIILKGMGQNQLLVTRGYGGTGAFFGPGLYKGPEDKEILVKFNFDIKAGISNSLVFSFDIHAAVSKSIELHKDLYSAIEVNTLNTIGLDASIFKEFNFSYDIDTKLDHSFLIEILDNI